jgi:hypothetical protein
MIFFRRSRWQRGRRRRRCSRRGRESDRHHAVPLAFADDHLLLDGVESLALETQRVRPGIERDLLAFEPRQEQIAVHRNAHFRDVCSCRVDRAEDDRRHCIVDVGEPLRTVGANHRRALGARAREELLMRGSQFAVVAQRLRLFGRRDALIGNARIGARERRPCAACGGERERRGRDAPRDEEPTCHHCKHSRL